MMNQSSTDKRWDFVINALYWLLIALIVYLLVKYVLVWLMPFLMGFLIAAVLNPAVKVMGQRLKIGGKIAAGIALFLFYITVMSLLWIAGFSLWSRIAELIAELPMFITSFTEELREFLAPLKSFWAPTAEMFPNAASGILGSVSGFAVNMAGTAGTKLPSMFVGFLFTVISSIFILLDYERIKEFIECHAPKKAYKLTIRVKDIIKDTILRYARAYAVIMIITFIELSIAFYILKINNATAMAALIALIDILPVFGCGTVLLPWIVFLLLTGKYSLALGLAIVYVVVTVVRNFVEPRVVGSHLGLHPVAMMACLCFGFFAGGVGGMFVTPCVIIVLVNLHQDKG